MTISAIFRDDWLKITPGQQGWSLLWHRCVLLRVQSPAKETCSLQTTSWMSNESNHLVQSPGHMSTWSLWIFYGSISCQGIYCDWNIVWMCLYCLLLLLATALLTNELMCWLRRQKNYDCCCLLLHVLCTRWFQMDFFESFFLCGSNREKAHSNFTRKSRLRGRILSSKKFKFWLSLTSHLSPLSSISPTIK